MMAGRSGLLNAPTGNRQDLCGVGWCSEPRHCSRRGRQARSQGIVASHCPRPWPTRSPKAPNACAMVSACGKSARVRVTRAPRSAAQKKMLPHLLVTTPKPARHAERGRALLSCSANLDWFVADEWYELLGSKRGVQVELALSRLKALRPNLRIWRSVPSANIEEAMEVLVPHSQNPPGERASQIGSWSHRTSRKRSRCAHHPEKVEHYPWSGHLGLRLAKSLLPIVEKRHQHAHLHEYTRTGGRSGTTTCWTSRRSWPGR